VLLVITISVVLNNKGADIELLHHRIITWSCIAIQEVNRHI